MAEILFDWIWTFYPEIVLIKVLRVLISTYMYLPNKGGGGRPIQKQAKLLNINTMNKTSIYDTVNSRMCLTVYHKLPWQQARHERCSTFHFLKYKKESEEYELDNYSTELKRVIRVIESKSTGEFRNNPIKTICLYLNANRGKTIEAENKLLMKLVFTNKILTHNEIHINPHEKVWFGRFEAVIDEIDGIMRRF